MTRGCRALSVSISASVACSSHDAALPHLRSEYDTCWPGWDRVMLEFSPAVGGRLVASTVPSHHAVHPALRITRSACQQEPCEAGERCDARTGDCVSLCSMTCPDGDVCVDEDLCVPQGCFAEGCPEGATPKLTHPCHPPYIGEDCVQISLS